MSQIADALSQAFAFAPTIFQTLFAVVASASAVTAMTPTPRDDTIVGKIYRIVEILALNIGRAKQAAPNRSTTATD